MEKYDNLLIIPNENENENHQKIFRKAINSEQDFVNGINEFCINNHIRINDDDITNTFIRIASQGYMIIKTSSIRKNAMCFIPVKVSDNQYSCLYSSKCDLENSVNIKGYYLKVKNGKLVYNMTRDLNKIVMIANKKNSLQEEMKGLLR